MHDLYRAGDGSDLRPELIRRVNTCNYFQSDILILSARGYANTVMFKDRASTLLRVIEDDSDDDSIVNVAKQITRESKSLGSSKTTYTTRINSDLAAAQVSDTLLYLLSNIYLL